MTDNIPALLPDGDGHQFVIYGDSCSGVPGALHESTLRSVNKILRRLDPQPEFICFPGDEIIGLTPDEDALRAQWMYWFDNEMGWLDRDAIPMYHTTANHTTYDSMSRTVYRDIMAHLPQNGPPDGKTFSYYVRRGDLLMIFTDTLNEKLGGEGRVETGWLDQTLIEHADARHKLVFGHHPVFPVNGFSADYQRQIEVENGRRFWDVLVRHDVFAYVCSHLLAFDVQVHQGVLHLLTAGAGTAHRMPEGVEYLHLVQAALDANGLCYQVIDTEGVVREALSWPLKLPPSATWADFSPEIMQGGKDQLITFRFVGTAPDDGDGTPQTLVCGWHDGAIPSLWIGLVGQENRLAFFMSPTPGRSSRQWYGPPIMPGRSFSLQFALHPGMGPGGLMWRRGDDDGWTTLRGASAQGVEMLESWPARWTVGHGQHGASDYVFRGDGLRVKLHTQSL